MNSKHTVCEGNVNWVNWDQNGINWHRYVVLLFHFRGPHKVLLCRWTNFSCSEISFTYMELVNLLNIEMGDTHKFSRPVKLSSAA